MSPIQCHYESILHKPAPDFYCHFLTVSAKMCVVKYNQYACKHKVVLDVDRCRKNLQNIPCCKVWKEEAYRTGECLSCVMEEPAGQAKASRDSSGQWSAVEVDFHGHCRLRVCRFSTLNGCRWHSRFPQASAARPGNSARQR